MTINEFEKVYWRYYQVLENGVLDIEPYVSFCQENYDCFSNEFIKLYEVICSEIDVICSKYCKYIKEINSNTGEYKDIKDYAKFILTQHYEISSEKVYLIEQSNIKLVPWENWSFDPLDHRNDGNPKNITPSWWKHYNKVKHNRSDIDKSGKFYYQYANLRNVLNALAALYVLEKYFYADMASKEAEAGKTPNVIIDPVSKLFGFIEVDHKFLVLTNQISN